MNAATVITSDTTTLFSPTIIFFSAIELFDGWVNFSTSLAQTYTTKDTLLIGTKYLNRLGRTNLS
jgi:hypothetical protein